VALPTAELFDWCDDSGGGSEALLNVDCSNGGGGSS